ncbi:peptidase associated/transthyretin-like domain-containing protein [Aquimarina sp. M1]
MKNQIISVLIIKCFLITALLFCSNIYSQSAIELRAVVADRMTRQPIAYANIGFTDRGVGTVSDREGYFELSFLEKRITKEDTLQLTMQGYYPLRIAFSNLKSVLEKTQVLFLSPLPNDIKTENSVERKNLVQHQIGAAGISSIKTGWLEGTMKGAELASLVSVSSLETYLDNLRFTVLEHKADSTKIRINIYDVSTRNTPGNKVATSIYQTITKKNGEEIIDLANEDIKIDEDFIVGIELLESYGEYAGHLQIGLSDNKGTSFVKSTSQDSWQELPYTSLGFLVNVLQSSEVAMTQKQTKEGNWITGMVTASDKPVQGCEVSVKDKLRYTYTKANGSFSILAGEGDILQFRSLVNEPKDVLIESDDDMKVFLKPKYDELGEVVIKTEK